MYMCVYAYMHIYIYTYICDINSISNPESQKALGQGNDMIRNRLED